jgi:hypothetical protein
MQSHNGIAYDDVVGVVLRNGQLVVENDIAKHPDPVARCLASIGYEPSGLDEFHPDTTHNPDPTALSVPAS